MCLFLLLFSSDSASSKRPLTYTYFLTTAKILEAKSHSGYRKRIYQDAEQYGAFYDERNHEQSIWYPKDEQNGEQTDLHISLMFADKLTAHNFLACLVKYNIGHSLLKGRVEVNKTITPYESTSEGTYVYSDEYKFDDSDSPPNTQADIQSTTEVSNSGDPIIDLRTLEDLSQIPKGEGIFKCHIAPQAFYGEFKNDPNNIIFGSHLFHNYFDGDGKRRPEGEHANWGTPPRLKIQYESTGNNFLYLGVRYYAIHVLITFSDPEMARAMDGRWREGSSTDGDLKFRSFFYSSSAVDTKKYLDWKLQEVELRWRDPSDVVA